MAIEQEASLVPETKIVAISSGVTEMLTAGDSLTFIRLADKALYAPKSAGRDCVIRA